MELLSCVYSLLWICVDIVWSFVFVEMLFFVDLFVECLRNDKHDLPEWNICDSIASGKYN